MFKKMMIAIIFGLACHAPAQAFNLGDWVTPEQLGQLGQILTAPNNQNAPAAGGLSQLSNQDQIGGLKQALTQGAEVAVKLLAKKDGYWGNEQVRIPLPQSMNKAEQLMRQFGMGAYADELHTKMNRAAEAAVPEAKQLFVGAVKQMTIADAQNILLGDNDAATQFFRSKTESALAERFKPIVRNAIKQVKLAETYNRFAAQGAQLGLIDPKDADLNDYVTRKAMDGLFLMMAEQELQIRENPLQATGALAQKVFGALQR